MLSSAVRAERVRPPVAASAPVCGQPLSSGARPELPDARAILEGALGIRACDHRACDVDGNGAVSSRDAQRAAAVEAGAEEPPMCPTSAPARAAGTRILPGHNGCTTLMTLERCRLRAGGGPTDNARVACRVTSPTSFNPGGLFLPPPTMSLVIDDSDGPCFEATVFSESCKRNGNTAVCRRPSAGIERARIHVITRHGTVALRIVVHTTANLACMSRSSSPWSVGLLYGEHCGETGCPVDESTSADCPGTCGNGTVDGGEECDPSVNASICTSTCRLRGCGDGIVDPPEECDDTGESPTCDSDCTLSQCGDGTLNSEAGEVCDDGNVDAGDGCSPACLFEECGNGIVDSGEECDDAGESAPCDADCTAASCGDGTVNTTAGEQCEANASFTCEDLGYSGGTLTCSPADCRADTSGCFLADYRCNVFFRLTSNETLGALQYDTDYSAAPGEFVGSADQVQCVDLVQALALFNDADADRELFSGMIKVAGFTGPVDVARCRFDTDDPGITPAQFAVTVVDAADPNLNPENPTVEVGSISCTGNTTTTVGGPTTTVIAGTDYDVEFQLDDATNVGALQYAVNYALAPGEFKGSGASTADGGTLECTALAQDSSNAFYDDDAGTLRHGMISVDGVMGPTPVARCVFTSDGQAPMPSDFAITVEDATDPEVNPVSVTVSVSSITPH